MRQSVISVLLVLLVITLWLWLTSHREASIGVHNIRVHNNAKTEPLIASSSTATLPAQLQGVPYNVSLGCWHVRADARGPQTFHVAAEANFGPGERWEEAKKAITKTHSSNPGVHYILVTRQLSMLELARTSLADIPHDLWFCPDVLYGTPIHIGNLYSGPKFTVSIDNWFPAVTWLCSFTSGQQRIVYLVQRRETRELTDKDAGCEAARDGGSADGFLYDNIPSAVVEYMRFPRTYWGCENVAMFVLRRAGFKLVNLCPFFAPTHIHSSPRRNPSRLFINHPSNTVHTGEGADMQSLCRQLNATSLPRL